MEKKKLDMDKVSANLAKRPEDVIGLFISPMPVLEDNKLYYTVHAYRKGDSKNLGYMNISLNDILTKLIKKENK